MPLWKRATEKVTNHAVKTAKKNLSETVTDILPLAVMLIGFGVTLFSGNSSSKSMHPVNVVIKIVNNK